MYVCMYVCMLVLSFTSSLKQNDQMDFYMLAKVSTLHQTT